MSRFVALAMLCGALATEAQIVAPAGRTLFNDGVLLRTVVRFDDFETEENVEHESWNAVTALVWGARPNLSLSFVAPYSWSSTAGQPQLRGSGDASVFARYDLLRRNRPGGTTRLAPELGVKLPTGGAHGSGSTDLSAGLVFSHITDPNWWISDVQYTHRGTGDDDLQRGDQWRVDLAYLRRVYPARGVADRMVLAVLELSGIWTDRSRVGSSSIVDSGGAVVTLSPGLEMLLSRRLVLELAYPIHLQTRLNGVQPEPETSVILGARWLF